MRHIVQAIIVLGLTGALLAAFVRHADLSNVRADIADADTLWLLLAVCASSLAYVLRSKRWQFLLRPIGSTRFASAFKATAIGFAASFLLPGRSGEVLRPYLLARREGLNPLGTFATVAVERVLDMMGVLLLFAGFLLFTNSAGQFAEHRTLFGLVRLSGLIATAVSLGAFGALVVAARDPGRVARAARRTMALLPTGFTDRALAIIGQLTPGFAILRRPTDAILALAGAFPLWSCTVVTIWCVSNALRLDIPLSGTVVLLVLLVVGVAAPTPGGLGGFHYAFKLGATTFFGIADDRAVGAAIVLHAVTFFPITIVGLLLAARDGLSVRSWRRVARSARVPADGVELTATAGTP
jgi:uncharacterized protein (TIRG00374 family)